MKLQDNRGQFKITIPRDLAKIKGWKQGTELAIVMNSEGDLVIKEIKKKKWVPNTIKKVKWTGKS